MLGYMPPCLKAGEISQQSACHASIGTKFDPQNPHRSHCGSSPLDPRSRKQKQKGSWGLLVSQFSVVPKYQVNEKQPFPPRLSSGLHTSTPTCMQHTHHNFLDTGKGECRVDETQEQMAMMERPNVQMDTWKHSPHFEHCSMGQVGRLRHQHCPHPPQWLVHLVLAPGGACQSMGLPG